jgi:nucleoside-diphosphate-sugar epimerase
LRVVLTGGGGLLGRGVAERIAASGSVGGQPVEELVLADIRTGWPALPSGSRVKVTEMACDVRDPAQVTALIASRTDILFHLAAIMSGPAERDFPLGWAINLEGTRNVLEACRGLAVAPRLIFTSTAAIYGEHVPDPVPDDAAIRPSNSYGAQKAMCELMIEEYSRRGFVDGRIVRVAHVAIRLDDTHQGAGAFISQIVKGPLAGQPTVCPVPPEERIGITTPETVLSSLLHVAGLAADALPDRRIVQLPALTLTVAEIIDAVSRAGGDTGLLSFDVDGALQKLLAGIPAAYTAARAQRSGFPMPPDIDGVIAEYRASAGFQ